MNKKDLVEFIANDTGMTKTQAEQALNATIEAITKALKKGNTVTLVGFGSWRVVKTPARKGRNPRTGAVIQIKAGKKPKFSAGKALKEAVS